MRERQGARLRIEMLVPTSNERRKKAAVLLQAMWAEVGVELEIVPMEVNALNERLLGKRYQAALAGWSAGLFVDPTGVWHSDPDGESYPLKFTGNSNPAAVWRKLERTIYPDQPYLFLYWAEQVAVVDRKVIGATPDLMSPLHGLERWKVAVGAD